MSTSTSALPGTTILNLPIAGPLNGQEWVPGVQGGTTVRMETGAVSGQVNTATEFVLVSSAPAGLPQARQLAGQASLVSIIDGGAGGNITVGLLSSGLSVHGNPSTTSGAASIISGTANQVLTVNSAGNALGFGQVNLSSSLALTGTLGTNYGGTGGTAFTPYQLIIGGSISSSPFQSVTAGTSGFTLIYVSSIAAPVWQSIPGFTQAIAGNMAMYTSSNSVGGNAFIIGSSAEITIGSTASSITGKLQLISSAGGITTIAPSSASPTLTAPTATGTLTTTSNNLGVFTTTASSQLEAIISNPTGTGSLVFGSTPSLSSAVIVGGQINTISSFGLRTTGASFDLVIGATETLTQGTNLNIRVGNANRNLILLGDFANNSSFPIAFTSTAASSLAIPVTGTLATLAGAETFTNHVFDTNLNTFKIAGSVVVTESNMLDTIGSSQGALLYRSSIAWVPLTVGTSAQTLLGGSIPQWGSLAGSGTVTGIAFSAPLTGGAITSSGNVGMNATITPQGRLTLSTGNPVMATTVSGSSTIIYTPYLGNLCPIYNGTSIIPSSFAELSNLSTNATVNPSAAQASTIYDMFVWNNAGAITLSRGSSWATSTARASSGALTRINGVLVNNAAITNGPSSGVGTYVGTVATNGSALVDFIYGAAASGGTAASLNVWNYYNRVDTATSVVDSGAAYTYASVTTRQARASTGNQIGFLVGLQEDGVVINYAARGVTTGAAAAAEVWGIGLNSVTAYGFASNVFQAVAAAACTGGGTNSGTWRVPIGTNFVAALEGSDGSNSNTFNSTSNNTLSFSFKM